MQIYSKHQQDTNKVSILVTENQAVVKFKVIIFYTIVWFKFTIKSEEILFYQVGVAV